MDASSLQIDGFPLSTFDKIRYSDTDRQGHVNNAVFANFLETGRVEVLYNPQFPILTTGASFVIASLNLAFLKEITWPGTVEIGTGIVKTGNSSIRIYQGLFQQNQLAATAETVIVQVNAQTGKGEPLTDLAKDTLKGWQMPNPFT
ncbi:MAG: thioesterase family protein [Bacteroidota bacterium]